MFGASIFIFVSFCLPMAAAKSWQPASHIKNTKQFQILIDAFSILEENSGKRPLVEAVNEHVEPETTSALYFLITNKDTKFYFENFTPPSEREESFYTNRHADDLAGLRFVLQNTVDIGAGQQRLISAIFGVSSNSKGTRFQFLKPPAIEIQMSKEIFFMANPPNYFPVLRRGMRPITTNPWIAFNKKYGKDTKTMQAIVKQNRSLLPNPDAFRIRVEIEKNKFVGLSYTTYKDRKTNTIRKIAPGMNSIYDNEIYHNITVWARADHCQGCHEVEGKYNRVSARNMDRQEAEQYSKMTGVRPFLNYVSKNFGEEPAKKMKKLIQNPSTSLLPKGLVEAITLRHRKLQAGKID